MKQLILLFTICISIGAHAQWQFETVDRKKVEAAVTEAGSENEYAKILKRFNDLDTTLTHEQYRLLYYGFVFQEKYDGYNDLKRKEYNEAINKEKYDEAIKIADEALAEVPVSLELNFMMLNAQYIKDKTGDRTKTYMKRYGGLLDAVLSSGNGLTCETAFKTIFVDDEYNIMEYYFELEHTSQYLIDECDMFDVTPNDYYDEKKIYFDTSETLMAMMKMFQGVDTDKEKNKGRKKGKEKK